MVYALLLGMISVFYLIAPQDTITMNTLAFQSALSSAVVCACIVGKRNKKRKDNDAQKG
tara:strand:+ start:1896 stop:2072 length:177 start_codon:yes stop_codon:yes gene_type:complete